MQTIMQGEEISLWFKECLLGYFYKWTLKVKHNESIYILCTFWWVNGLVGWQISSFSYRNIFGPQINDFN